MHVGTFTDEQRIWERHVISSHIKHKDILLAN